MFTLAEKITARSSFLHSWEARHKLAGITALIFSFSFVRDLRLLPLILAASALVYYLTALPPAYLFARLRLPSVFLLVPAMVLPFGSGQTVLARVGPLALKLEGSLALLLIAAKFISILTLAVSLFATTPLAGLAGAMRSLGVPSLLVEMVLFTYRYIFQLAGDLKRTGTAATLRGFKGRSLLSLKTLAYMVGTLLVRSYDQSERVFQAMTLRGYGRVAVAVSATAPCRRDRLALAGALALAASVILVQVLVL